MCVCMCKVGTQIEMQSVELNRIHVHVTMIVSESVVSSSDRCIVCRMYNWCVCIVHKKIRHTIVYKVMYATMQVCAQEGVSMSSCTMFELKVV